MSGVAGVMRKAGGGSIVNVVSIYTVVGDVLGTAYAAGKGALKTVSHSRQRRRCTL